MKNITRNELLTVGLFAAFVFIATVTISFGQNFNLGPVSAMSRYFAQAVSTMVLPVTPATVNSTQKTTSVQTVKTAVVTTKVTQCNDGIDNDKDGDADSNDYSCANGTTEDSLEKKLDPQIIAIAWPGGPRFANLGSCQNYCRMMKNECRKPIIAAQDAAVQQCASENGCRINRQDYVCVDPNGREIGRTCRTASCDSCVTRAREPYTPQLNACDAGEVACRNNCAAMFPRTTTPAPSVQ